MPTVGTDKFANMAAIGVTETGANTLTFAKLETGISLFEKMAWIINRIEYRVTPSLTDFADSGDLLDMALTVSGTLTSIGTYNEPAILNWYRLIYHESGTPANFAFFESPRIIDLSTLPGGGLIVPPNPLYLAAKGTGLGAAQSVYCRFWYTNLALKPEEYWELVESRRIIST